MRIGLVLEQRLHRGPLHLFLTVGLLALLTTACGADASGPDAAGRARVAEGGAGAGIDVLRVGAPGQIGDNLDPLRTNGIADYTAVFHLYDTLVRITAEGTELALAESIEPNAGVTEWTIRIREATFHDGRRVTAEDVVASLRLMSDADRSPNYAQFFSDIDVERLRSVDERTVVVPLVRPRGDFVDTVLTFASFVFPAGFDDWRHAVGSGPYQLEAYEPGRSTVLVASEDHWEGRPTVERIEIMTIDDPTARLNAVRGGELDIALKIDPAGAAAVDPAQVQIRRGGTASAQGMALVMNTTVAPFDNLDVRRAMAVAIDRQALVDAVLLGFGTVGNDVIGAGLAGYNESIPQVERDIATARRIFAEHGVGGVTLVVADVAPGIVSAGELLVEQLAEVGVTARLDERDAATYYSDYAEFTSRRFQGMYWVNRPAPAFLGNFTGRGAYFNPSGYTTSEYERLLAEAQAAVDPVARQRLFDQAQRLFHREAGTIVWGYQEQLDATAPGIEGLEIVQSIPLLSRATQR